MPDSVQSTSKDESAFVAKAIAAAINRTATLPVRLRDPLSEVTRRERRTLMGMATLGIGIAHVGVVPERIQALGVEFSAADQRALLVMLSLITTYFLGAFMVYAASDVGAWMLEREKAVKDAAMEARNFNPEDEGRDEAPGEPHLREHYVDTIRIAAGLRLRELRWVNRAKRVSYLRVGVDIVLPVVLGATSIIMLLSWSPSPPTGGTSGDARRPVELVGER